MPSIRVPAMYMTMVDIGEMGNMISVVGNRDSNAAPPPMPITIAMKSNATKTTAKIKSTGLQITAIAISPIFNIHPTTVTMALPNDARKERGLSDRMYSFTPFPTFSNPSVTVLPMFSTVTASPRILSFSAAVRASGTIIQQMM